MARNHTGNGVRVSWKIVPAVTEVWHPHSAHSHRPRTGHALPDSQRGQRKPAGQRSRARYPRHASSVPKFASNSVRFRGYSSAIPAHYILRLPESSRYPSAAIQSSNRFLGLTVVSHLHECKPARQPDARFGNNEGHGPPDRTSVV